MHQILLFHNAVLCRASIQWITYQRMHSEQKYCNDIIYEYLLKINMRTFPIYLW